MNRPIRLSVDGAADLAAPRTAGCYFPTEDARSMRLSMPCLSLTEMISLPRSSLVIRSDKVNFQLPWARELKLDAGSAYAASWRAFFKAN